MKQQIKPVSTQSLVDRVEVQFMDLLAGSEVKAGDVLPKETELADAFGVSRTVVREALTRLKVRGLIESSKRKGSVVTHPDGPFVSHRGLVEILERGTSDVLRQAMRLHLDNHFRRTLEHQATPGPSSAEVSGDAD